jgi:prefoldin subunit 5
MSVSKGGRGGGSSHSRDASSVLAKVNEYEQFIELTLKRDLAVCMNAQEKVQQMHTNYSQLRQSLLAMQSQQEAERAANGGGAAVPVSELHSMVNLGSEFYMHTVVPDPTRVFIDVGLGFHVELSLAEALAWIDLKLPALDKKVAAARGKSAMVQSKIKLVLEGISELMQLQNQQQPQRQVF